MVFFFFLMTCQFLLSPEKSSTKVGDFGGGNYWS